MIERAVGLACTFFLVNRTYKRGWWGKKKIQKLRRLLEITNYANGTTKNV